VTGGGEGLANLKAGLIGGQYMALTIKEAATHAPHIAVVSSCKGQA